MGKLKVVTVGRFEGEKIARERKLRKYTPTLQTKNNGSALGYLGTKAVYGLAGLVEGFSDFVQGTIYQLSGDKEYAQYLYEKDIVGEWTAKLDREYNPGGGMKVAGDVATGVGQAIPSVVLGILTSGGSTAVQVVGAIGQAAVTSAYMGRATTDAVKTTGELGAKENAYGVLSGALEGVTDKFLGGTQKAGKALITAGKSATKTAAGKVARNTLMKHMLSAAGSEALEEFVQEYADTYLRRATGVDKDAQTSLSDAMYSALIGGLTGGFLGGAAGSVNAARNISRGESIKARGLENSLLATANYIRKDYIGEKANFDNIQSASLRALSASVDAYNKLSDKSGTRASMLLGEIQMATLAFESEVGVRRVMNQMMQNPTEALAAHASTVMGRPVTVEELRNNVNGITEQFAVQSFATGALTESNPDRMANAVRDRVERERYMHVREGASFDGTLSADGELVYRMNDGRYAIVTADQREGNEGKYRVGFSATPEYDPDHILINPGSATVEEVRTALTGLNDGSLVVGEKGLERAQTSKNAPASDGGAKIEQTPTEATNEAQGVENAGEASLRHDLPKEGVRVDPKSVTEKDVRTLLEWAKQKKYRDRSYIPVRVNTPQALIDAVKKENMVFDMLGVIGGMPRVDDNPMSMPVYKARQAQANASNWDGKPQDKPHNLSVDEIIQIIEAMDDPEHIVFEEQKNGKDRYVEIVRYEQKNHAFVVIEPKQNLNADQVNGYEGGTYNSSITIYPVDNREINSFLEGENHKVIYDKKRRVESQRSGGIQSAIAVKRSPFANSIPQNGEKSTPSDENISENVFDNAPEGASDNDSKRSALSKTREAKERKRKRAQEHQRQSREKRKAERMAEAMREEVVRNAEQNAEVNAEQGTEAQETVEKAKIPARGYTDAEANDARVLVKDFDLLPAASRRAIVELMRSGKASGASKNFLRHSANLIAYWRKGLWIIADDKTRDDGFYYVLDDGTRLITVNPKREAKAVSETLMHELAHDIWARADAKIRKTLYGLATAGVDKKEIEEIRERYRTELTNRGELTKRDADGNTVDMTEAEINALLDEEVATNLLGETIGTEEFLSRFDGEGKFAAAKRIWRTLYNMKKRFTGKDKYLYRKADDLFKQFTKVMAVEEVEGGTAEMEKRINHSLIKKDGKYYNPSEEELIKKHPTISEVDINDAKYSTGLKISKEDYKAYRKEQNEKAKKLFGVYTNKDTAYSDQYGKINAEFCNLTIGKTNSYGGIALFDVLPHIPQIFENAIVLGTKADSDSDPHIKGIVDLVGCAILGNKYLAIVKLNVKEYTNDEAKIYDNRVLTIEELTVVERERQQNADSTSSAVSSEHIISRFRSIVNKSEQKNYSSQNDKAKVQKTTSNNSTKRNALPKKAKILSNISLNEADQKRVEKYNRALEEYRAKKAEMKSIRQELKALREQKKQGKLTQEGKDRISVLLAQQKQLKERLQAAEHRLMKMEALEPIQNIIKRERAQARKEGKSEGEKQIDQKVDESASKKSNEQSKTLIKLTNNLQYLQQMASHRRATDGGIAAAVLLEDQTLKKFVRFLGKRGTARGVMHHSTREGIREFLSWYSEDNEILRNKAVDELYDDMGLKENTVFGDYHPEIRDKMERIANGSGDLTVAEISDLADVVYSLGHLYMTYGKVKVNDRWVDAKELAREHYAERSEARRVLVAGRDIDGKPGAIKKLWQVLGSVKEGYLYSVVTPEVVLKDLEGNVKGGVLSSLYREIRLGEAEAKKIRVEILKPVAEFFEKHKAYRKKLSADRRFEVNGLKLTTAQAVGLWETSKREHAQQRLFDTEKGGIYAAVPDEEGNITSRHTTITREDIQNLFNQFTEEDIAYINALEESFRIATKFKEQTDGEVWGYTNVIKGHYYPITTDENYFSRDITDARDAMRTIDVVNNKSFNKNTVDGAQAWLFIEDSLKVLERHSLGIGTYSGLYLPLKAFGQVYGAKFNKAGVPTDKGDADVLLMESVVGKTSLRQYYNAIWSKHGKSGGNLDKYLAKLFSDIQGITGDVSGIDRVVNKLQSGMVVSSFGLNAKVILTQLASYGAAYKNLDADVLVTAVTMPPEGEMMDKYSKLTLARDFDGVGAAEVLLDKISDFGRKTTKGIDFTDRQVILALYNACRLQVEKDGGGALGDEQNYKKAAEMLDNLLLDTQTTSLKSDASALMRDKSLVAKMFTMFRTESMKSFSNFYTSIATYANHRQYANAGLEGYAEMLDEDKKRIGKTAGAFLLSTAWVSALSIAFSRIRKKARGEKEEEKLVVQAAKEVTGNVVELFPIISDAYSFFADGYELEAIPISAMNDALNTIRGVGVLFDKNATDADKNKYIRNGAYSVGSLVGIPNKNADRIGLAILTVTNQSTAYLWNDRFKTAPTYEKDLEKALSSGNERLAGTILSAWWKNKKGGKSSDTVTEELLRLYTLKDENGKEIFSMPKSVPSSLDQKTAAAFSSVYAGADAEVVSLISSKAYATLDDAAKAKAIKACYDIHWSKAAQSVGLESTGSAARLASAEGVDPAILAAVAGYASAHEGENRKAHIIQYLISLGVSLQDRNKYLAALGYKVS